MATAEAFGRSIQPVQHGHLVVFFTVSPGVPVIVAMIFIVAAEALVPSGSGPGPVELVRALRRRLTRARRYSQISRIAVRHGLGPYLRGRRLDSHRRAMDARGGPQDAADELLALLPVLRRLPRRVERITGALERGRLSVNVLLFADERDRRVVTGLVHQTLLTFLGAVIGVIAVLLLGAHGGPAITPTVSLFQVIGYNLIVVSSVLIPRVLFRIFTAGR